jgi:hypothetical protein
MLLRAFGQKPFPAALPPARERGASALCLHARTKAMLPFAGSLGSLESAFHDFWERVRRLAFPPVRLGLATVKGGRALSIGRQRMECWSNGVGKIRIRKAGKEETRILNQGSANAENSPAF